MNKQKRVSDWWLDAEKTKDGLIEEMATFLRVGKPWVEKNLNGKKLIDYAKTLQYDKDRIHQLSITFNYLCVLNDYKWERFRYENRDNEWGVADSLKYYAKTKTVRMLKSPMLRIVEAIEKVWPGAKEQIEIVKK